MAGCMNNFWGSILAFDKFALAIANIYISLIVTHVPMYILCLYIKNVKYYLKFLRIYSVIILEMYNW